MRIRQHISDTHPELHRLARAAAFRRAFTALEGDRLSRVPRGFSKDDPAEAYLRHRNFLAGREFPPEFATTATFYPTLLATFKAVDAARAVSERAAGRRGRSDTGQSRVRPVSDPQAHRSGGSSTAFRVMADGVDGVRPVNTGQTRVRPVSDPRLIAPAAVPPYRDCRPQGCAAPPSSPACANRSSSSRRTDSPRSAAGCPSTPSARR